MTDGYMTDGYIECRDIRGWVTSEDDARAGILKATPRGEPGDCFYAGGWRCAGRIWNQRGPDATPDHLVTIPFFIADGDPRHSVYCAKCASAMGVPEPA